MSATDVRYGRQGGRWAPAAAGQLTEQLRQAKNPRRQPVDRERLFHPDTLAQARAHQRRRHGSCAHDTGSAPCDCDPDAGELAELWAARARMATARQTAGQHLDPVDREALYRQGATVV